VRVLVTRPAGQAADWMEALQVAGLEPVSLPLIEIVPPDDLAAVDQAWQVLSRYAQVMFVSPTAVASFFDRRPAGQPWPVSVRAAAVGQGSWRALLAAGVERAQVDTPDGDDPAMWESEGLWRQVLSAREWAGRRVLIVRGQDGRDWLRDQWIQAGAQVDLLAAYARRTPALDLSCQRLVWQAQSNPTGHVWLFSSSEAVRGLVVWQGQLWQGQDIASLPDPWHDSQAVATHPRIAQAAREAGFGRVLLASASLSDVVRSIESLT